MFEDKQSLFPTFLGCGVFLLYGAAQLVAGYQGIAHHVGTGWAIAGTSTAKNKFDNPLDSQTDVYTLTP